jgi:hypothetical protein
MADLVPQLGAAQGLEADQRDEHDDEHAGVRSAGMCATSEIGIANNIASRITPSSARTTSHPRPGPRRWGPPPSDR